MSTYYRVHHLLYYISGAVIFLALFTPIYHFKIWRGEKPEQAQQEAGNLSANLIKGGITLLIASLVIYVVYDSFR